MKNRYLRILKPVTVYANHDLSSRKVDELKPEQLIPFNREKRREGKNWMEIYLDGEKVAYIEKDSDTFYRCEEATLDDEIAVGFNYTQKLDVSLPINMLFFPEGELSSSQSNIGRIKLESIENSEEDKQVYITLEYSKDALDVEEVRFRKDENFYIINETEDKNDIFIEVDNLKGKKGFLLKKTNSTKLEDKWIYYFSIGIVIITVVGIFLGFLANGWLVVSGLMVVVGIVIAFVLVFIIQIILMILKEAFNQVRKRF